MCFSKDVWKTDNTRKKARAMRCVGRMKDPKLLTDVVLSAPLWHAKMCAIHTLRSVSEGRLRLDEPDALRALLGLDISFGEMNSADLQAYQWYVDGLLNCLPDEHKLAEVALKARSGSVRRRAFDWIHGEIGLMDIIGSPDADEETRMQAVRRINRNSSLLKDIAGNGALPEKIREAAAGLAARYEEEARREAEKQALKEKQAQCSRRGHRMSVVRYKAHGNGGTDAVYRCELCGAEEVWPYEWSSADSV